MSSSGPQPSGHHGKNWAIALLSLVVIALGVALVVSLATRPSPPASTGTPQRPGPSESSSQATSRTCGAFADALTTVKTSASRFRPAQWSFADPGVDTWLRPYVHETDQAVTMVEVAPGTDRTVSAAVNEWVTTMLMGDQALLHHDNHSVDIFSDRIGAAEVASRQACGQP